MASDKSRIEMDGSGSENGRRAAAPLNGLMAAVAAGDVSLPSEFWPHRGGPGAVADRRFVLAAREEDEEEGDDDFFDDDDEEYDDDEFDDDLDDDVDDDDDAEEEFE